MDEIKILNIGCGNHDYGDVRIDRLDWKNFNSLAAQEIIKNNLIKADMEFLPIKTDSVSEKVFCFHALEHVLHPYEVLKEVRRVMRPTAKLELNLPNAKLVTSEHVTHLYSWTPDTITNILRLVNLKVTKMDANINGINMMVVAEING